MQFLVPVIGPHDFCAVFVDRQQLTPQRAADYLHGLQKSASQ